MLFSAIFDIYSVFNEYNKEALLSAMAAILIYIVAVVVIFVVKKKKNIETDSPKKVIIRFVLFVFLGIYFAYLICLTLSGREAGSRGGIMNLIPFSTIFGSDSFSVTLLENIILFIPFGILLPAVWNYFGNSIRTAVAGLISSTLIESTQLITSRGYFDIDDIILNTLGALTGYLLFVGIYDGFWGIRRRFLEELAGDIGKTVEFGPVYNRFALRQDKVLMAVQAVPVVGWYLIIMGFSSNNGYESGYLSKSLLYKILVMLGGANTLSKITEDIDEQIVIMNFWEAILRKSAHMLVYAIFAILVWALLYSIRKVKKFFAYNLAIVAVSAVGVMDEINQLSVLARTGTYVDVIIDLAGASLALIAATFVMFTLTKKYVAKYEAPSAGGVIKI